ncbi:MAG: hypothetical protein ABSG38_09390 [Spirochaetia bacterium]
MATRSLTCGDCRQGLARIRCSNAECRHEYFRPFSCKGFYPLGRALRRLCPSCSQKRTLLFAEYLDEQLLLTFPPSAVRLHPLVGPLHRPAQGSEGLPPP